MKSPDDNDLKQRGELAPKGSLIPFVAPAEANGKQAQPSPPVPVATVAPRWRTASSRIGELVQTGDRLSTGFPSLDRAIRGGLLPGKRVIVGGPPGAGKTTLTIGWIWQWAQLGHHVAFIATDEPLLGIMMRIAQAIGIDREDLEYPGREGHESAKEDLRAAFDDLGDRLLLVDGDDDLGTGLAVTVEIVSAELKRRRVAAGSAVSILAIDSVQTATTADTAEADGPRARVDAVMEGIRRAAVGDGHLTVTTSEVSRGSYASPDPKTHTNDLAAFKESGGIEFKADLAIMLRVVGTAGGDLVDAAIPKNRLRGLDGTTAFRLELNRSRATFAEVDLPSEDERDAEQDARDDAMRERIVTVIKKSPTPITSQNQLRARCNISKPRIRARDAMWNDVAKELIEGGEICHSRTLGYHLPPTDADRCRTDAAPAGDDEKRTDAPLRSKRASVAASHHPAPIEVIERASVADDPDEDPDARIFGLDG